MSEIKRVGNRPAGYKVYYDNNAGKYLYETELSRVGVHGWSQAWFTDLDSAIDAAAERNVNDLNNIRKCKSCGRMFYITRKEKEWYHTKNLEVPRRCEVCRKKNKKKG